jgi:PIN domain nuclease of toxin-antitoxin system
VNRFLLDTHVLLWFIQKDPQLSDRAREVIVDDANLLFLSIASLWEITVKINIGKLKIGHTIDDLYRILAQFTAVATRISHTICQRNQWFGVKSVAY